MRFISETAFGVAFRTRDLNIRKYSIKGYLNFKNIQ